MSERLMNSSESEESEPSDTEQQVASSKAGNSHKKNLTMYISEQRYHCPNCTKSFVKVKAYQRHLRSHLQYHPYECNVCLECFSQKELLRAHKEMHSGSRNYSCSKCSRSFSHLSALNRHKITHMEKPPYLCPMCDQKFPTVARRSRHVKNHVVSCQLCKSDFQDFPQLMIHIVQVHRSKPTENTGQAKPDYIVPMDPDKVRMLNSSSKFVKKGKELFSTKSDASEEEKKFTCFVCEHRFSSGEAMTSHLKAHRLYMCPYCPKYFAHKSSLREHEFIHTGNDPFKCDACQSIFPSAKLLSRHQEECPMGSLVAENPSDLPSIMNTLNNAVDISNDVKAKVESAIQTVISNNTVCKMPLQRQDICSNAVEVSRDLAYQSSDSLTVSRNVLDGSILSTRHLDECITPSLDFNNLLHFYWLISFMNQIKSMTYPLSNDLHEKVIHINSVLCKQLTTSTGTVSMKSNFTYLMFVQKELSFVLENHLKSLYAKLS